jgi:hypothetical protein
VSAPRVAVDLLLGFARDGTDLPGGSWVDLNWFFFVVVFRGVFLHFSVSWSTPEHVAHCIGIPSYSKTISTSPPIRGIGSMSAEGSRLMSSTSTQTWGVDDFER